MAIVMGKKWLRFVCLGLAITASIWVLTMNEAAAKSAFPSKTITYVVPTSPGGGFDTFSRMIIPYLRKYLPGNPNIIIKNAVENSFCIASLDKEFGHMSKIHEDNPLTRCLVL